MFNAIEFIEKKRDGGSHSEAELQSLVNGAMDGSIALYQLSAWLMAAYLEGLDDDEIMWFTKALANSGETVRHPAGVRIVDKHSTGGVGDKVTLVLVPLVASCGARVSKLSGPGLGYTGGTVDKLNSIPGMNTHLREDEFAEQVERIGCAVSGHSLKLAPAEGIFYRMRDVTATVSSIPLITSSIISKKLAGGADGFVFDVKCGSGAFMQNEKDARALAEKLVQVSRKLGKQCKAVLSDMEQPLGRYVGNAAEVCEAVQVMNGGGPEDTRTLCAELGGAMLTLSGVCKDSSQGRELCLKALDDGAALKKFTELVQAQGGDANVASDPEHVLPLASHTCEIKAARSGVVSKLNALMIGEGLRALGGGRLRLEDKIDPAVSVELPAKTGDSVDKGAPVLLVHYNEDSQLKAALPYLQNCVEVSDSAEKRKLIIDRIE
jgi:pyrimidine-nucleoside phosphorylase